MSAAPTTRGQQAQAQLTTLLRARNPIIWIASGEELRVEAAITEAAASIGYEVRFWDCAQGVTSVDGSRTATFTDPQQAIAAHLEDPSLKGRQLLVMRDLAPWLNDPSLRRQIRNAHRSMQARPTTAARALIFLQASGDVPPDLRNTAALLEWPIPDRVEIATALRARISKLPEELAAARALDGEAFDRCVDAAVGLPMAEADNCFAASLVSTKTIDPALVSREKRRVVGQTPGLTWYEPDPRGLDAVGGLDQLKPWLRSRAAGFSARARSYGLDEPRGVLIVGIPGTGKSLSAKAIASAWGLPLLRLDFGALRGKFVGDSEGNIRRAFAMAETIAPAILWIDEMEKALGGASGPAGDGGVAADALGATLSWMQEKKAPVFVIATCNDVSALPPELLRKGRWDEIFFVDLPTRKDRAEILATALAQRGRTEQIDLAAIADVTESFSGAEVAALVPEAMYAAFADGERAITTMDILAAATRTVPLAKTAGEKIAALRKWSEGRARPASSPEAVAPQAGRDLDI